MLIRAKERDRARFRDASGAEVFIRIGLERIAGRLRSTRSIISLNSPYALEAYCAHNGSSILGGQGMFGGISAGDRGRLGGLVIFRTATSRHGLAKHPMIGVCSDRG